MNPQEFPWTEDQQVTVTNPTDQPYRFKVHNKDYELGARKSAKMPGYIAWVYVYGLSVQLAQAEGVFNRWNEEGFRQEFYNRLIKGVDELVQNIEVEEEAPVNTFDEVPEEASDGTDEPTSPNETTTPEAADRLADTPPNTVTQDSDPEPELPKGGATPANIQPMTPKARPQAKALRSNG